MRVHATAAIDPKRRFFVLIGSGTGAPQALRWHFDRPGRAMDLRPLTAGDKEIERAYAPGFDFHPASGVFVAWSGGADVYVLDPAGWRWTRRARRPEIARSPDRSCLRGLMEDSATYRRWTCSS